VVAPLPNPSVGASHGAPVGNHFTIGGGAVTPPYKYNRINLKIGFANPTPAITIIILDIANYRDSHL